MNPISNKNFKIFIDFDGTITQQDVGEEMFLKFGDAEKAYEIVRLWIDGKISSTESWLRLCETVINLDMNDFNTFIDSMHIDPFFKSFIQFADKNNYELTVLSDGLDYYIERILKRENLDHLRVYSNKVNFGKNNKLELSFPYTDEECFKCANCKRNHVINHSGDEEISIYIGDGFSDTCPAQYCDYIFAKRSLLKYCEKNRISYYPFTTFNDVIKRLNSLKNKKFVKKRHQADLKRKEVYMQG
jgi:2,3-diketo-5-methylthio-1-phosphopentane phosphatase